MKVDKAVEIFTKNTLKVTSITEQGAVVITIKPLTVNLYSFSDDTNGTSPKCRETGLFVLCKPYGGRERMAT